VARFLVVDDDPSTTSGLTHLLRGDGHEVASFTAGGDAVDALSKTPYDVVLTDLEMPHVDGYDVVRAAREHQPQACLVVATARAHEAREQLLCAGACLVADKPFDYDRFTSDLIECRAQRATCDGSACRLRSDLVPRRRT
jgi:two-component system response regulator HydG